MHSRKVLWKRKGILAAFISLNQIYRGINHVALVQYYSTIEHRNEYADIKVDKDIMEDDERPSQSDCH